MNRTQRRVTAVSLAKAADFLEKAKQPGLAQSVDRLNIYVQAGFDYRFQVTPLDGDSSRQLSGTFNLRVVDNAEDEHYVFEVLASAGSNKYSANTSAVVESLANKIAGGMVRARIKVFPIQSSLSSGPQSSLMINIELLGDILPSGSINVNVDDIAYKRVGSTKVTVDNCAQYIISLAEVKTLNIMSIVRPTEYSVVVATVDGQGAIFEFSPVSDDGVLNWTAMTKSRTVKKSSTSMNEFMRQVDSVMESA